MTPPLLVPPLLRPFWDREVVEKRQREAAGAIESNTRAGINDVSGRYRVAFPFTGQGAEHIGMGAIYTPANLSWGLCETSTISDAKFEITALHRLRSLRNNCACLVLSLPSEMDG
jgi:hypothetical protein